MNKLTMQKEDILIIRKLVKISGFFLKLANF